MSVDVVVVVDVVAVVAFIVVDFDSASMVVKVSDVVFDAVVLLSCGRCCRRYTVDRIAFVTSSLNVPVELFLLLVRLLLL